MKFENRLDTVLLIDDEPYQTEWLADYFLAHSLKIESRNDLQSALESLQSVRYRYVIVDLNIPFSPSLAQPLASQGSEFFRYPGLMAAQRARSTGHNTYQTIVYSVHDSDEVQQYTDRIRCRYILKGRPRELKLHIEATMKKGPHGWLDVTKESSGAVPQKKIFKPKTGAKAAKVVKVVRKRNASRDKA